MRNVITKLLICVGLAVLLGRFDDEALSFADVLRFENIPGLLIYSAIIYLVISAISRPGGT